MSDNDKIERPEGPPPTEDAKPEWPGPKEIHENEAPSADDWKFRRSPRED